MEAVFLTWSNSFRVPFLMDDQGNILQSQYIRHLWPIWDVLFPPVGALVGGRPLYNLSFALNYAVSGLTVWSYHLFNILVHALSALWMFALVRRTLLLPDLARRFGRDAGPLAFFTALIWALHPLHTDAVTYISQRAESMMGLFFLASLYFALRGWEAGRSRKWHILAVLGFVAGVGVKEVIVVLPLVALAYEWVFFHRNPFRAVRNSPVLYGGFGVGLTLLVLLVAQGGTSAVTPETKATPLAYLVTQAQVIVHYLGVSFWPSGLCLDYDWPIISFREAIPYGVAMSVLLGLSALLLARRRPSGFLGAWFFLILAPTSSIMPLPFVTWDRRMYLSLAAVVALVLATGYERALRFRPGQGTRRFLTVAGCLLAIAPGAATYAHNMDYRTSLSIWRDVVEKRPENHRAWAALSFTLRVEEQYPEAEEAARKAIALDPGSRLGWLHLGNALEKQGRLTEAVQAFERAIIVSPEYQEARCDLGTLMARQGHLQEATALFEIVLRHDPNNFKAMVNHANTLLLLGKREEARLLYEDVLKKMPDNKNAARGLASLLEKSP